MEEARVESVESVVEQPEVSVVDKKEKKKRVLSEKQLEALKRGRELANQAKRAKKEEGGEQKKKVEDDQKKETPLVDENAQHEAPVTEKKEPPLPPLKLKRQKTHVGLPKAKKERKIEPEVKQEVSEESEDETFASEHDESHSEEDEEDKYVTALPPDYFQRVFSQRSGVRVPKIQITFA